MARDQEPFTSAEIDSRVLAGACLRGIAELSEYQDRKEAEDARIWAAYRAKSWWYRTWHGPPGAVFGNTQASLDAWSAALQIDRLRGLARLADCTDLTRIRLKQEDALMLREWLKPGGDVMELRTIRLGGREHRPGIDLSTLGFRYHVSDEALEEIRAAERRQASVLTTAHLYLFGGRP